MVYDIVIGRNEEDRKRYDTKGTILLGKHYVKMGQVTSLSNEIMMDMVRSHVVFIVGKRGGGKCLTGDTLIALSNGSMCELKELAENTEKVYSLSHDLKMKEAEKTEFFRRTVNRLLKIKLRSGKEIKLTPEHPLLTIDGWQEAKELGIGSRIATPRIIPCFGNRSMPEHEIKILSYMLTEGHTKKPMFFSNNDQAIIWDLRKALKDLHPDLELTYLKKANYKVNSRRIKRGVLGYNAKRNLLGQFTRGSFIENEKTPIRQLIERGGLYGKLAIEKKIPDIILKLPKNLLALFMNRAFSCDGSIYKPNRNSDYWEISYSTSSSVLGVQVHHILLRFGILSKLRTKLIKGKDKNFISYEVVLDGENVKKFIQEIGFFGEKERKQYLALQYFESIKHNPNVDTIPKDVWNHYRPENWAQIGREMGYKHPKAMRESLRYSPSRQKLLQIAIADNNERLKALAQSDIFWDEIIEKVEIDGSFEVYDITVPNTHNFVANDVIVHNSYTMGVIAEGMADMPSEIKQNLAIVIFDTMGIYWTMKYPNKKDEALLSEWKLKPKGLNVAIYTPAGYHKKFKDEGIPTDYPFSIKPSELSSYDWCLTFGIDIHDQLGVLIEKIVQNLAETKRDFSVEDILQAIEKDAKTEEKVKNAAINRFTAAMKWGIFSQQATSMEDLVKAGQVTVLDISAYAVTPGAEGLRAMVIGILSKKLFTQRMIARKVEELEDIRKEIHYLAEEEKKPIQKPIVWLVIDEGHEFLPNEGKTAATDALVTVLREGREPGISLIIASQQPGKIHTDVMTQADIVIAHHITAKLDIDALGALMQSYMREGLDKQLNYLPRVKGAAIVFDDVNERMYPMRIRPRLTWHGGGDPSAIQKEKKTFEF